MYGKLSSGGGVASVGLFSTSGPGLLSWAVLLLTAVFAVLAVKNMLPKWRRRKAGG